MKRATTYLCLLITLISSASAWAQAPAQSDTRETWMGVYVIDEKVGYLKVAISKSNYNEQDGFLMESVMHVQLTMLNAETRIDVKTTVNTDVNMKPLFEKFEMSSGGATSNVEATFLSDVIKCKQGTTNKDVPIPPGANLMGDTTFFGAGGKKPLVGDKLKFHQLNPLTLTLDPVEVEILRQEKVTLKDKVLDTYVIKSATTMGEMTSWQEENGDLVKIVGLMGMMFVRETKEEAMSSGTDYKPPSDFAVLTSVKADKDIRKPGNISYMKLRLVGFKDKKLLINDSRQQATWVDVERAADYVITAQSSKGARSEDIPFKAPALQPYLAEAPYVQPNDATIKQQALSIVGSEKRAFRAASKIRKWVHDNMKVKADMGIIRSSVDIMKNRQGVCRDYAILYTALARAVGIPTRIVAGLVFLDGSFYYHAWAESYTGEWTPFDATLSGDFVDATHIKLTQGDATSMFEIAKVIGGLKAQIQDYKHLEK